MRKVPRGSLFTGTTAEWWRFRDTAAGLSNIDAREMQYVQNDYGSIRARLLDLQLAQNEATSVVWVS
jgi:hypothetical protein